MRTTLPILLVVIGCLHPAQADEQQAVYGKTVEEWSRVFRDKASSKADRLRAVWALGCFGPDARPAVPDLIDEVRQGQIKDEAVETLVRIGAGTEVTVPVLIERFIKEGCLHLTGMGAIGSISGVKNSLVRIGGPAVPALLDVLKGPNRGMRVCAAEALGEIGPSAQEAVPLLIRAIEHPDADREANILSDQAVRALGRIGPEAKAAAPTLTALLEREGSNEYDVVIALDGIGVRPVRKLLGTFLREGDSFEARMLAWLGPKAREAVPALRGALTDKRPQVRISAAVALAHIDFPAPEAIPVLIEALRHPGDEELDVSDVPGALAHLGPKAKAALPMLIGIVKDEFACNDILKALVLTDPEGRECVPALIAALKHEDYDTVHVAANCLSLLGPRAEEAVPALAAAVTRDFDGSFSNGYDPQASAAHALRRIGPRATSAIPALIVALKYRHIVRPRPGGFFPGDREERDSSAAAAAAQVLGSFGAAAKAAVSALIEAAQAREKDDANWAVRKAAILALGRIGPDAKAAIPVLRNLMKEDGKDSRDLPELVAALYQLAPDGSEIAEGWLAKQVPGSSLEDRVMVLGVMGRTSLEADRLTRRYLEQLDPMLASRDARDGPNEMLEEWFEMLGRLGRAGRLAVPRSNEYRKHPDPWVRMWATEALERIMPPIRR